MKHAFAILFALAALVAPADTITFPTYPYAGNSTTLTGTYTNYAATNLALFKYYGFPTVTETVDGSLYNAGAVRSTGMVNLTSAPPIQVAFDFTGTNMELIVEAYRLQISDGQTITAVTSCPTLYLTPNRMYLPVRFSSNTTHHLLVSVQGGLLGINANAGSHVSARTMPLQNLLIVLGDSYTEGYMQDLGGSKWFNGWAWQLAQLVPNTIVIPSGIGGTGFLNTSPNGGNYASRVATDVCALYTNAVNSGKYGQIFITASGSVNDNGQNTNSLYTAATNVYSLIKTACPTAHVFFVGNWRQGLGFTAPTATEINEDRKFQQAAVDVGIPYYSPIQAGVLAGGPGTGNYDLFFPPAEGTDNTHPGRYGCAVMAAWLNPQLANTYGSLWGDGVASPNTSITNLANDTSTHETNTGNSSDLANSSLTVADYGAVGDAVQFYVGTTSNSTLVRSSLSLSTNYIGKVIEVFRVGTVRKGPNEFNVAVTDNEDLVTIITNIVSGTNIYIAKPCLRSWTNTFATAGTDNSPAFESAIAAASGHTNFVVNIPSGTFLVMPKFRTLPTGWNDITYSSIYLNGGGIHFKGAGMTNTVLLGKGAWNLLTNAHGTVDVYRGILVEVSSIYQNPFTNDYPLVFSDMTMDGGLEPGTGRTTVNGYPANPVTGAGWGGNHNAYQLTGADNLNGRASYQVLSNVMCRTWRAEMVISVDTYKNGAMLITNCVFTDGNATALNIYPLLDVGGNTFANLFQVAELYQYWCNTGTNRFHDNLVTNIVGNGFAWNGATATNAAYLMDKNTFYFNNAGNCLLTTPAANLYIISNTVTLQSDHSTFLAIGTAGYQGYWMNSNIVVSGNTIINNGGSDTTFVQFGAGAPNNAVNVVITNNTALGVGRGFTAYDDYSGVIFEGNTLGTTSFRNLASTSPYVLIAANNHWSGNSYNDESTATKTLYYNGDFGPKVKLGYFKNGKLRLDDSSPSRIPMGAVMEIDNTANNFGAGTSVLPSRSSTNEIPLPNGSLLRFYWTGSAWSTNNNPSVISYGAGRLYKIVNAACIFLIDDLQPNLIPSGATLTITNMDSATATVYGSFKIYKSTGSSPRILLPPGQSRNYSWTNGFWRVVNPPLNPPTGL